MYRTRSTNAVCEERCCLVGFDQELWNHRRRPSDGVGVRVQPMFTIKYPTEVGRPMVFRAADVTEDSVML